MTSSEACALGGAAVAAATLAGYAVQINGQGDDIFAGRRSLVAASLSVAVLAACVSGLPSPLPRRIRVAAYGVSSGALIVWAMLGVFSIGAPLFAAALLVLLAGRELIRDSGDALIAAATGLATVAVIAAGLA